MKQLLDKLLKSKLFWILMVILSPIIIIYLYFYFYYGIYQRMIQKELDMQNPQGNRGSCISIIKTRFFPYTTFYYGDEYNDDHSQAAFFNREGNEVLHELAKHGLYTEVPKGEDKGHPIYEYDLTELGKQYTNKNYPRGYHVLCFGRIVVDHVYEVRKEDPEYLSIDFKYRLENVPEWIKDPKVHERYNYKKSDFEGGTIDGWHSYQNTSNGKRIRAFEGGAVRI